MSMLEHSYTEEMRKLEQVSKQCKHSNYSLYKA